MCRITRERWIPEYDNLARVGCACSIPRNESEAVLPVPRPPTLVCDRVDSNDPAVGPIHHGVGESLEHELPRLAEENRTRLGELEQPTKLAADGVEEPLTESGGFQVVEVSGSSSSR